MRVALVVPVKSFDIAKGRLADVLSASERSELAMHCAESVVRAGEPWPVYVVCDSDAVASWAASLGATVVRPDLSGLNTAVRAGCDAARHDGAEHIVVAHGDLPLARSFADVVVPGTVSIVPDRHRDGTNVIALPATSDFVFQYGTHSFTRHCEQLAASAASFTVIEDDELELDLDTADDLTEFKSRMGHHQ